MSDVRLTSNGDYWKAVWIDSHGRRRSKGLGPKAKLGERQARKKCRELAATMIVEPARRDMGKAPPLAEWLDRFMAQRTDLAATTRQEYELTRNLLLDHFGPHRRLDQISRADAADFRAWLSRRKNPRRPGRRIDEQTVRKHIRNCRVIFRRAVRQDLTTLNPYDAEPASPLDVDKDWRFVSRGELEQLLDACPSSGWRAMLALCRLAGLRRGEAQRIQWAHIDFDKRRLTVEHEGARTTKKRSRVVPIQPRLYEILMERFEQAEPGESVTGLGTNNLNRNFEAIVTQAGLTRWGKLFHTLRKNCESEWLAEYPVMAVCEWLGHDPDVAAKHYHQTQQATMDQVTGWAAEQEKDELEQAKQEIERLRRRVRRVIAAARKARNHERF